MLEIGAVRQALAFLTECALPPRNLPGSVISRVVGRARVSRMYEWPEDRRAQYATWPRGGGGRGGEQRLLKSVRMNGCRSRCSGRLRSVTMPGHRVR